jgi:hypothetical protein
VATYVLFFTLRADCDASATPPRLFLRENPDAGTRERSYGLFVDTVATGIPVTCIEGRRVGSVEGQAACCLAVRMMDNRLLRVSTSAVLAAEPGTISLMCSREGVVRYPCAVHGAH